jgi:hypothetical protein
MPRRSLRERSGAHHPRHARAKCAARGSGWFRSSLSLCYAPQRKYSQAGTGKQRHSPNRKALRWGSCLDCLGPITEGTITALSRDSPAASLLRSPSASSKDCARWCAEGMMTGVGATRWITAKDCFSSPLVIPFKVQLSAAIGTGRSKRRATYSWGRSASEGEAFADLSVP